MQQNKRTRSKVVPKRKPQRKIQLARKSTITDEQRAEMVRKAVEQEEKELLQRETVQEFIPRSLLKENKFGQRVGAETQRETGSSTEEPPQEPQAASSVPDYNIDIEPNLILSDENDKSVQSAPTVNSTGVPVGRTRVRHEEVPLPDDSSTANADGSGVERADSEIKIDFEENPRDEISSTLSRKQFGKSEQKENILHVIYNNNNKKKKKTACTVGSTEIPVVPVVSGVTGGGSKIGLPGAPPGLELSREMSGRDKNKNTKSSVIKTSYNSDGTDRMRAKAYAVIHGYNKHEWITYKNNTLKHPYQFSAELKAHEVDKSQFMPGVDLKAVTDETVRALLDRDDIWRADVMSYCLGKSIPTYKSYDISQELKEEDYNIIESIIEEWTEFGFRERMQILHKFEPMELYAYPACGGARGLGQTLLNIRKLKYFGGPTRMAIHYSNIKYRLYVRWKRYNKATDGKIFMWEDEKSPYNPFAVEEPEAPPQDFKALLPGLDAFDAAIPRFTDFGTTAGGISGLAKSSKRKRKIISTEKQKEPQRREPVLPQREFRFDFAETEVTTDNNGIQQIQGLTITPTTTKEKVKEKVKPTTQNIDINLINLVESEDDVVMDERREIKIEPETERSRVPESEKGSAEAPIADSILSDESEDIHNEEQQHEYENITANNSDIDNMVQEQEEKRFVDDELEEEVKAHERDDKLMGKTGFDIKKKLLGYKSLYTYILTPKKKDIIAEQLEQVKKVKALLKEKEALLKLLGPASKEAVEEITRAQIRETMKSNVQNTISIKDAKFSYYYTGRGYNLYEIVEQYALDLRSYNISYDSTTARIIFVEKILRGDAKSYYTNLGKEDKGRYDFTYLLGLLHYNFESRGYVTKALKKFAEHTRTYQKMFTFLQSKKRYLSKYIIYNIRTRENSINITYRNN